MFTAGGDEHPGIYRVSAAGGQRELIATSSGTGKGEGGYESPHLLPEGHTTLVGLYLIPNNYRIEAVSLNTGEKKIILEDAKDPTYLETGHLIYEQAGTGNLMAVTFDPTSLEVTGDPIPVVQGVRENLPGRVDYAISNNGTLVYVPGGGGGQEGNLIWVDRDGTERFITKEARGYTMPRISPDGKRVSVAIDENDGSRNVWIYDLEDDLLSRLTFEGERNSVPIWSPDGKWITFDSDRDGARHLFRRLADGSGPAEPLITTNLTAAIPTSWSSDGSALAFHSSTGSNRGIWILPIEGDREPQVLITSSSDECCGVFSPDSKWLAYVSIERGQPQVNVSPYPDPDVKWLVSGEEGGGEPVWSPDGSELFYRSGDKMMVVPVDTEPTFKVGRPEELFEGSYTTAAQ